MKFKKFIFKSTLLSSLLICKGNIFAAETAVFCSDNEKNWYWLNNGNEKVNGTWKVKIADEYFYFNYFILEGGVHKLMALKLKCKQEFGEKFIFAQPADNRYSSWNPFALNENLIFDGHITYMQNINYNQEILNHLSSLRT